MTICTYVRRTLEHAVFGPVVLKLVRRELKIVRHSPPRKLANPLPAGNACATLVAHKSPILILVLTSSRLLDLMALAPCT